MGRYRSVPRGVQEIWLIRQEGDLLCRHPETPNPDAEYLAQRLIATHRFVRDSFAQGDAEPMSELTFGSGRLAFVGGRFLVLVVLVIGRMPRGLEGRMREAIARIEETYGPTLAAWQPGTTLPGAGTFLVPLLDAKLARPG